MICKECEREKNYTRFYKTNKSVCKECIIKRTTSWRNENYIQKLLIDARAVMKYQAAHLKERRAERAARAYTKKHQIIKPECQLCGRTETEMHHPDYDQPLVVCFLCRRCHKLAHIEPITCILPYDLEQNKEDRE